MRFCLFLCLCLPSLALAIPISSKAPQAYILDYDTGTVLLNQHGEEAMTPSSMTKLMTLYLLFDALKREDITLNSMFLVSEKAWKKGGSKMFVQAGKRVSVEDLIRGIIVQSGNDACIVVAEHMAGSEAAFAEEMNKMAQKIGLEHSHFKNATGWPDEAHVMSAKDIATLSSALIRDFPEYYPYFAEKEFTYANITQPNRNGLLYRGLGADGLKTGHTEAGGYGLAASAVQKGRRIISVVNGLDSMKARVDESERILRQVFLRTENITIAQAKQVLAALPVYKGKQKTMPVGAEHNSAITVEKDATISSKIRYHTPLLAPIEAGTYVAALEIYNGETLTHSIPLYALETVKKQSLLKQFLTFPARWFGQ